MDKDYGVIYSKKEGVTVKVTTSNFQGKQYVHIREYYVDWDTYESFPTKKGYAILEEYLEDVICAFQQVGNDLSKKYIRPKNQLEFDFLLGE